jgi:hypothetical protein
MEDVRLERAPFFPLPIRSFLHLSFYWKSLVGSERIGKTSNPVTIRCFFSGWNLALWCWIVTFLVLSTQVKNMFVMLSLSVSTPGKLKSLLDRGCWNRTRDLWFANPMSYQLSYEVKSVRVGDISELSLVPSIYSLPGVGTLRDNITNINCDWYFNNNNNMYLFNHDKLVTGSADVVVMPNNRFRLTSRLHY